MKFTKAGNLPPKSFWAIHTQAMAPPIPMCPRSALKRAVAAWEKHGLTPKIGIELEAYAFICTPDGRITPYDTPGGVGYSTGNFADPRRFTDAIWNKAQDIGLPLDLITTE